ncbi:MAG: VOC family protein [Verrucomicrobiota bacterium]
MIKQLAHVCFKSDAPEALIEFYGDKLGLPQKFAMNLDNGTPFGWYFELGETTFIEIFDKAGAAQMWGGSMDPLENGEGARYQHFCIQVKDIEDMRIDLLRKGVEVTECVVGLDHSIQCWIKDPDGNSIELMEYTDKSMQF